MSHPSFDPAPAPRWSCLPLARLLLAVLPLLVTAAACGDDNGFRFEVPDAGPMDDAGPPDAGIVAPECTDEGRGATIGETCLTNAECDDGCFCNGVEVCRGGLCDIGSDPCDDGFECTTASCDEEADACSQTEDDAACDDGNICNGVEVCTTGLGCASLPPAGCGDGDPCTLDLCNDETGVCENPIRDLDGDGFATAAGVCGGDDCDDNPIDGAAVNPDADEDCNNGIDDDCDLLIDFVDEECAPTNVDCAAPELIAESGGTLSWSSFGLPDNFDLDCDLSTSIHDSVFSFTLTEQASVVARVVGGGTSTTVELRSAASCAEAGATPIACDRATTPEIAQGVVPAGDYVLIVSTRNETLFSVTLEVGTPMPPPPADTCGPGSPLIPVDATTTFSGLWADYEDDFEGTENDCASISSFDSQIDIVHRLSLTEPKDVRLSAVGTTGSSGSSTSTALYVVSSCDDLAEPLSCALDLGEPELRIRPLPAGEYFVILERSSSGSTGTWELTAEVTDPVPRNPADACTSAPDITDTISTIGIDTLERDDGLGCDRGSVAYRDAYFLVDLAEARDVTVETTGSGLHLMSFADGVCGDATAELLCRAGTSTVTETFRNLDAGQYYVAIGTARSSGTVSARATTAPPTPPPANDTCEGAATLTSGGSTMVSTVGATDTVDPSCGGDDGLDAWYEFTLTEPKTVILTAEPAAMDRDDAVIELYGDCGSAALGCASGDPASLSQSLEAGTYRVAVESDGSGEKQITLRLVVLD
jgi:hypothetical protein